MRNGNAHGKWIVVGGAAVAVVLIGLNVQSVKGYPAYRIDVTGGYCSDCHGHFWDDTSPKGTQFPNEGKHGMHRNSMGTSCFLCHTSIGDVPQTGSSAGTANNPGVGCTGCHGRDYGGATGNSAVGLRLHHYMNNVSLCVGCHGFGPDVLAENVSPTYYGTVDTDVDDPCNVGPTHLENWSLDLDNTHGLDNDGDNQYDEIDINCGGCPWDCALPRDGAVGITDFLALLAQWGQKGTPCDTGAGNPGVGINEFLALISNWGLCP